MKKFFWIILILVICSQQSFAYKVFYYDSNGNRVYKTIEQKDFAKYKNAPKRSFVRQPRTNWEITDRMRARKMTISQYTNRT